MPEYETRNAYLAPSLRNLFREIDARWPLRGKGLDGWIGDKDHQSRQSDHNPDSRGIVHAIDITYSQWTWQTIIAATTRNDRPSAYVIHRSLIRSRKNNWSPRPYTGSNPHTHHIHVSILYGTQWESDSWQWGIADLGKAPGTAPKPGVTGEFSDWRGNFDAVNSRSLAVASNYSQATRGIIALLH